jgi:hypothetical protein
MRKPFVGAAGAFACASPDEFAVISSIRRQICRSAFL